MGVILLLTPILWGATFPAAKIGLERIGVFTPLLGLALFRRGVRGAAWGAALVSVLGMALLSVPALDDLRPRSGDLLVLASAVGWAGHAVGIGYFAGRHPTILLSLAQMAATAALHLAALPFTEARVPDTGEVWLMLLITGVFGSGVAYTLQVVAQRTITG